MSLQRARAEASHCAMQHVIKQGTVGMALYFGQSGSCKIVRGGETFGRRLNESAGCEWDTSWKPWQRLHVWRVCAGFDFPADG
eukprot:763991-Hanusia_phi.AAC.2